ncbi:MAG: NUDIX hydrolase [Anaerolinea sp.]|nr:NUDIX hydrolase [Anaerolinea sp.]MCC6975371.1 NUDIX hydrolase [Anaerolineae bacterium]CAG1015175.1 ADP-ribose pyrophosphatase [Anaerolineae bacterium]
MGDHNQYWRARETRLLVDRSPHVRVFEEDLDLPSGAFIPGWLKVELPDFAIIFALLEDGQVPLVRQYRRALDAFTLELPAGGIETGEIPLITAQRELREETGVEAAEWFSMGSFTLDANRGCGVMHAFAARGAHQVAAPDHGDLGDLSLCLMPLEEVRQRWRKGQFPLAPTMLTIGLGLQVLSV